MAQQLQRFRAHSFAEALKQMRHAMGEDAIVVRTTDVKEGGLLGLFGKKLVEITASAHTRLPRPRPKSVPEKKYAAPGAGVGSEKAVQDTVAYFQRLVSDAQVRMRRPGGARSGGAPSRAAGSCHGNAAVARVLDFKRERQTLDPVSDIRDQLRDLHDMVAGLAGHGPGAGVPSEFAPHYKRLLKTGMAQKQAAALLAAVVKQDGLSALEDHAAIGARVARVIEQQVRVTGGVRMAPGECRRVAFIGPTGVGKTTSLAKLAAHLTVREGARVGLITADTYRVAAPEQLRVYADIIGLPMHIVNDAREMEQAVRDTAGHDLVLMDTAGGSPFNFDQLDELRGILEAAGADEIVLVLAANTRLEDLRQVSANFGALGPSSLFFSKLDETRHYGPVFSVIAETGLPVSYFSVGQEVPDDLVLAQPELVADLITKGGEYRGGSSTKST